MFTIVCDLWCVCVFIHVDTHIHMLNVYTYICINTPIWQMFIQRVVFLDFCEANEKHGLNYLF